MLHNHIEQRIKIFAWAIKFGVTPTGATRGVKMWEIKLFFGGIQVGEQIETFIQRAIRLSVWLVDFVQYNNRAQTKGKRLGGHEFGLWHRAFSRVDQQNNTVNHGQDALHFAAKIGVTWRVDDIDAQASPLNRCGFGEDRDTAFAFQIIGVHRPFGRGLVVAVSARLFQ